MGESISPKKSRHLTSPCLGRRKNQNDIPTLRYSSPKTGQTQKRRQQSIDNEYSLRLILRAPRSMKRALYIYIYKHGWIETAAAHNMRYFYTHAFRANIAPADRVAIIITAVRVCSDALFIKKNNPHLIPCSCIGIIRVRVLSKRVARVRRLSRSCGGGSSGTRSPDTAGG